MFLEGMNQILCLVVAYLREDALKILFSHFLFHSTNKAKDAVRKSVHSMYNYH
jgi:hypothetical protein